MRHEAPETTQSWRKLDVNPHSAAQHAVLRATLDAARRETRGTASEGGRNRLIFLHTMWAAVFTGAVAAAGAIMLLPKTAPTADAASGERAGGAGGGDEAPSAGLVVGARSRDVPPGAIDVDTFRARKAAVRYGVDALIMLSIVCAVVYVLSVDYGWQPGELVRRYLPREAALARDLLHGLRSTRQDALVVLARLLSQLKALVPV